MKKSKRVSYLATLRFDKQLLNSFQAKYLSQVRFPILLTLLVIIIGVFSFMTIPRRLNPEIKIPLVIVNTVMPGAGPDDVEQLVTILLERELAGVDGLNTLTSVSRENVSTITVEFIANKDTKDALAEVQTSVNRVNNLPDDALTPSVQSIDFEDQPFWTFSVTSRSDSASLMRFSDELQKQIENVADVDRVQTSGFENQTIEVVLDLQKVRQYNLNPAFISGIVKTAAHSFPAGTVNSSSSTFSLTINQDILSIEDIRNLRINQGIVTVRLGDIAEVSERTKSGQQNTYIAGPHKTLERAVQFFVYKKSTADIDHAFSTTQPIVNAAIKKYNGQFSLFTILNTSDLIAKQFGDLYREFANTSILVFLLLLVFLGIRQGIISNVTVPLTFLATFAIIQAFGLTLNFLTVFSLLLTLGILIDDTIVVVAAMTRYYKTGRFTPFQTGIMVWRDFIIPLWSSAITTIWGFVPLLLSTGIIGVFIKSIPLVVTTTMLTSTIFSVFVTIPLMIIFLKPEFPSRVKKLLLFIAVILYIAIPALLLPKNALLPVVILISVIFLLIAYRIRKLLFTRVQLFMHKNKQAKRWLVRLNYIADHGIVNIEKLSDQYRIVIERILRSENARRKTLIAIGVFTIVAYLLVPLGFVKNEFFPKGDEELVYAAIDFPSGTNTEIITAETKQVTDQLRSTRELDYVVAEVGQVIDSTGNRQIEPDAVLFTLHLTKPEKREPASSDIADELRRKFANYTHGTFSVVEVTGGPPAGADVQIKLVGDDLAVLNQYADKIAQYLKTQNGIINISKSIKQGTSKVIFIPDKTKIADAGLSVDHIALWLRTYASGFTLDSVLFGDEEKDIIFRTNSYDNKPLEELSAIQIPLPMQAGLSVPLSSVGIFKLQTNPTSITREDQKRSISVTASVSTGINIPDTNAKLLKYADSLHVPEGYQWKTGGVNEENQKSVQSILQSMVLAFLLIFITMVIEFGSFRQAIIAMTMIPISIAGVFYIFALMHVPLSFAALIGVLALFGIVMRHAIVVMEKINENRQHGLALHDSISDAASSRLEPVLLTSLATIVGLLPITIADPFWRGLGGAIIAGLLFTGALKLFFIPVVYYNFFKGDEEKIRKRSAKKS